MSIKNPDILIPILDELSKKLRNWAMRSGAVVDDAQVLQDHARDLLGQSTQEVGRVNTAVTQNKYRVKEISLEAQDMLQKAQHIVSKGTEMHNLSFRVKKDSEQTFHLCNEELNKARSWLSSAEARLSQEEQELIIAEGELSLAEHRLPLVESALSRCQSYERRDKNGKIIRKDCSQEQEAVRKAQDDLTNALKRVEHVRHQVEEAKKEVARASARVNTCKNALSYASSALDLAQLATKQAIDLLKYAEECQEEAKGAEQNISYAQKENEEQLAVLDVVLTLSDRISNTHDQAFGHFRHAENLANTSQHYAMSGENEIEIRNDFLREFANIPDLPNAPSK